MSIAFSNISKAIKESLNPVVNVVEEHALYIMNLQTSISRYPTLLAMFGFVFVGRVEGGASVGNE